MENLEVRENRLTVGLDIDDVCWDLCSHWLYWYNDINSLMNEGKDKFISDKFISVDNIKSWDIDQYVKYKDILWNILEQNYFWESMPTPPSETYDTIKEIYDTYDTYFITDTNYRIPSEKFKRFFDVYDFASEDRLIICKNKGMIKTDVLVDDNPRTIRNANIPIKMLLDRPWNRQDKDLNKYRICDITSVLSLLP